MKTRVIVFFPPPALLGAIQALRQRFDPLADFVPPHITLVFPFVSALSTSDLREHIEHAVGGYAPFALRLHDITRSDGEYLFLNVKQGNDALIDLHDRLYTGPLAAFLNPAYTFTPHLTVGRLADAAAFQVALAEARATPLHLETTLAQLAVYTIGPGDARAVECVVGLGV